MDNGLQRLLKDLPKVAGNTALNFFRDRFREKAWVDRNRQPWPARKRSGRGSLLLVTGELRDSMRVVPGSHSVEVVSDTRSTDSPKGYGQIHNEGGTLQVSVTKKMRAYAWYMYKRTGEDMWKGIALTNKKRFTIRIPRRQFMGHSQLLMQRLEMNWNKQLDQLEKRTW